jgi:hypothetical protein
MLRGAVAGPCGPHVSHGRENQFHLCQPRCDTFGLALFSLYVCNRCRFILCLFVRLQVEKAAADATHLKAEYDKLLADSTEQKAQVGSGWCAAAIPLCCTYCRTRSVLAWRCLLEGAGVC